MSDEVRHEVDVVGGETFRIAVVFAPARVAPNGRSGTERVDPVANRA